MSEEFERRELIITRFIFARATGDEAASKAPAVDLLSHNTLRGSKMRFQHLKGTKNTPFLFI